MTPLNFLLVLVSEGTQIAGQILLKHGMTQREKKARFLGAMAVAIFLMSVSFFVWLALLAKFPLSYLFPFDGLNRIMLVAAASIFLKEKATPRLWLGVILITVGVLVVAET